MKRHVRLDDNAPRRGKRRRKAPYDEYLRRICRCSTTSMPPCGGCEGAIDEELFNHEFGQYIIDGVAQSRAIYWIIDAHHPHQD